MIVMIVHNTYNISILIGSIYDNNLLKMFTAELKNKTKKINIWRITREKSHTARKPKFSTFFIVFGGGGLSFILD